MSVATSLLLGALLGTANAVGAVLLAQRGRALPLNPAMRLVLGGGFLRLVLLLGAVVLVLAALDVHRAAFVGGLGVVFVIGLVFEVVLINGRSADARPPADA